MHRSIEPPEDCPHPSSQPRNGCSCTSCTHCQQRRPTCRQWLQGVQQETLAVGKWQGRLTCRHRWPRSLPWRSEKCGAQAPCTPWCRPAAPPPAAGKAAAWCQWAAVFKCAGCVQAPWRPVPGWLTTTERLLLNLSRHLQVTSSCSNSATPAPTVPAAALTLASKSTNWPAHTCRWGECYGLQGRACPVGSCMRTQGKHSPHQLLAVVSICLSCLPARSLPSCHFNNTSPHTNEQLTGTAPEEVTLRLFILRSRLDLSILESEGAGREPASWWLSGHRSGGSRLLAAQPCAWCVCTQRCVARCCRGPYSGSTAWHRAAQHHKA